MRHIFLAFVGAVLLVAASPVVGLNTDIPSAGLPSASEFSSSLLTELKGVVSWKTLSKVEPRIKDGQIVPKFSDEILGLDQKMARVQGFILPLDLGDKQHHFLLSAVPPHCPFCLPAGPEAIVEVLAQQKVEYGFEPVIMSGKFVVLQSDPSGLLYRLTDAEPIALGRE